MSDQYLEIRGQACHKWPAASSQAQFLEEGKQLSLHSEEGLWIDRFDVRTLLLAENRLYLYVRGVANALDLFEHESDDELFAERYRDLVSDATAESVVKQSSEEVAHKSTWLDHSSYPGLPEEADLPSTAKELLTVLHTCKSVRQHGLPFELVLKTKQSEQGSICAFLNDVHPLHAFYEYLRALSEDAFLVIYSSQHTKSETNLIGTKETTGHNTEKEKDAGAPEAQNQVMQGPEEVKEQEEFDEDDDLLDEDCDEHFCWGSFHKLKKRKKDKIDEEMRSSQKEERRQRAKLLRGHFLLQVQSSEQPALATGGRVQSQGRPKSPLFKDHESHSMQEKINRALFLLTGWES